MPRFFAQEGQIGEKHILITGQDVNHIRNVLRMEIGDDVTVSDGKGTDYFCHIAEICKDRVELDIQDSWPSYVELPSRIYLFQGLPKADKMDLIIQKTVELGVFQVIPVITARTVVKLDQKKQEKRLERWQAIAKSAAMQAGRGVIPQVGPFMSFREALDMCAGLGLGVMPYEKAAGMAEAKELVRSAPGYRDIGIFIGPEGGFEESEALAARERGLHLISLGKRILRTETAGMAMLSILMFSIEKDHSEASTEIDDSETK